MTNTSYGAQMQALTADAALREHYFDPATAELGDRVPYRDETDATDDRAWNDADRALAARGLRLEDNGDGYSVVHVSGFSLGDRVEGGKGDNHDTGRIVSLDGDMAMVAWQSGVTTPCTVSDLTAA